MPIPSVEKQNWMIYCVAVFLFPLCIYPMSIGPAAWIIRNQCPSLLAKWMFPYFNTVYWPIMWLMEQSDWFDGLVAWYCCLWPDL